MRAYRLWLHLYPASFRHEYWAEIEHLVAERRRQARGLGIVAFWLAAFGEVFVNATRIHLEILRQDVRYTTRTFRRSKGFALTAVLIAALGIGATTAAFSVTDFVLIRPLPFPEPSRLVKLWERTPGYAHMELSVPNYRDWMADSTSFDSSGAYSEDTVTIDLAGEPQRMRSATVSADLFPTLRVAPAIGHAFTAADDRAGASGTVMLSFRFWQTSFGGEPGVIGRTLTIDGAPYIIIGVMPADFTFPASDVMLWTTNRFGPHDYEDSERANNYIEAVGRLRPGVTIDKARADLASIAARLEREFPKQNQETGAAVVLLADEMSVRSRLLLLVLLGAAGCLLLIACTNLANLLLARALGRRRELAVRAAMGAGRERLVRQLMTESLIIAAAGGALGMAAAYVSVPLLTELVPATLPIPSSPTIDARVMTFAILLTLLTGVTFGLVPVLRASGSTDLQDLREGARAGGGRKERLRSSLVILEIMASVALLVGAGLLARALLTVRAIEPGFQPAGVLTLRLTLPMPEYQPLPRREAFFDRVFERIRALPSVKSAGAICFLPMSSFRGGIFPVAMPGDVTASDIRSENNVASARFVTPDYFRTLGIPFLTGRDVSAGDTPHQPPVAVVSESFAKRYWPGEDPLGRHFTFLFADREVVGVVGDVKFRGLERPNEPQVYLAASQVEDSPIKFFVPQDLAVRTTAAPETLAPAIRQIVREADSAVPVSNVQSLADMVDLETAQRSIQVRVVAGFAVLALVLTAVGIHGVLSFAVSQRVTEFGVRVALGATSRNILFLVTSRGLALAALGIVPGVLLAYAAGRSLGALLAGVNPADGFTYATAIGLALAMTVLGLLAPALRATRIDPIRALRAE